ncbi:hypothetical protein [Campylobacter concisus]|uniref:hypothetical protein n=1 Tax=Campylobacter concisus TaxID=199 RepID=UPI00122D0890|nr:hypothetical protein [Campylobacter concisus]
MVVGKELEEFNKKLEAFLKYISENKLDTTSPEKKSISPNTIIAIKKGITMPKENVAESIPYSQAIEQLENIYLNTHYRHAYSTITKYVVSQKAKCLENKKEEIEEDILQTMSFNIENIFEKIILNYKENVNNSKGDKAKHNFIEKVFKLKDHINLEIFRLQDIIQSESEYRQKIAQTEGTISELRKEGDKIKENIEELAKKADGIKESIGESKNNLKDIQREYITILGIFASIIIAFVATLSFSTSVLQNIDKPNTFKLVAIICFLSIFIVNILNLLFNFIREIHFGKEENKKEGKEEKEKGKREKNKDKKSFVGLLAFNIMIIIVAVVCLYCSLEYDKKYSPQKDSNSTINFNITSPRF